MIYQKEGMIYQKEGSQKKKNCKMRQDLKEMSRVGEMGVRL